MPEYIEAAVRAGEPELATTALERLTEQTQASRTEWALGLEARCTALLSDGRQKAHQFLKEMERTVSQITVREETGKGDR